MFQMILSFRRLSYEQYGFGITNLSYTIIFINTSILEQRIKLTTLHWFIGGGATIYLSGLSGIEFPFWNSALDAVSTLDQALSQLGASEATPGGGHILGPGKVTFSPNSQSCCRAQGDTQKCNYKLIRQAGEERLLHFSRA